MACKHIENGKSFQFGEWIDYRLYQNPEPMKKSPLARIMTNSLTRR
jgi:hypothetical protein